MQLASKLADEDESRQFQPALVDEGRCKALMWNRGRGQLQCSRKPLRGTDLCKSHQRPAHGRVRGAIPAKKLEEFRKFALKPEKESKQWYARHLMWAYASELAKENNIRLENLNEVDRAGQYKLTDELYERALRKLQEYI